MVTDEGVVIGKAALPTAWSMHTASLPYAACGVRRVLAAFLAGALRAGRGLAGESVNSRCIALRMFITFAKDGLPSDDKAL